MPVKKRAAKVRATRITPAAIAAYLRMKEIEAMDLPNGDPLLMCGGEYQAVQYLVHEATGYVPWIDGHEASEAMAELHKAASLPRTLLDKLQWAKQQKRNRQRAISAEYVLHASHPWGWDQEKEEAKYLAEWGVRPQDVDLTDLVAIKRHHYGRFEIVPKEAP
jgi:hypothetical protein